LVEDHPPSSLINGSVIQRRIPPIKIFFVKAFDVVDHDIMAKKLEINGFN
jgi:hypothetical protein